MIFKSRLLGRLICLCACAALATSQSLTSDASVIDSYLGGRCRPEQQVFELRSGLIQVSPADTLATLPHSLHLADCVARCARHAHCKALNFETGLCVLLNRTQPSLLSAANFPVFTLHAQKRCLQARPDLLASCASAWALDTLAGRRLRAPLARLAPVQRSALDCAARCLEEGSFVCRSANFRPSDGRCELLRVDRHSIADSVQGDPLQSDARWLHMQNACAPRPNSICRFRRLRARMLKTVDSLFEHITDEPSCRQLCLQSSTPCRTYTLGHANNRACRLSHLSTFTASHIIDPWMVTPGADTFELTSCYNVSVTCDSREMIAQVNTDRPFSGKLYAKDKLKTCVNDVKKSMEFDLRLPYDDPACGVQRLNDSRFSKDIVIQHHDLILTTKDIGLSLHCSYDLSNRTVQNSIRFDPDSEGKEELDDRLVHSSFVYSPNVTIQIKNANGLDVHTARVGDPLTMRFVMDDENTPYEIFIHDLVASDGTSANEIVLIDSNGCPTEPAILGAIKRHNAHRTADAESDEDSDSHGWTTDVAATTSRYDIADVDAQRPARLQSISSIDTTTSGTTITQTLKDATTRIPTTVGLSDQEETKASTDPSVPTSTLSRGTNTNAITTTVSSGKVTSTANQPTETNPSLPVNVITTTATSSMATGTSVGTTTVSPFTLTSLATTLASTINFLSNQASAKSGPKESGGAGITELPILRSKQLEATFEAFKFPTTNLVQFRAVITPCLGECAPVRCPVSSIDGSQKSIQSYGRRRKRRSVHPSKSGNVITEEPMIVVQSIQITDKYDRDVYDNNGNNPAQIITSANSFNPYFKRWTNCFTAGGFGLIVGLLLFGQIAIIGMWLKLRSHWCQWRQHSWTPSSAKDVITSVSVANRY